MENNKLKKVIKSNFKSYIPYILFSVVVLWIVKILGLLKPRIMQIIIDKNIPIKDMNAIKFINYKFIKLIK